ncbi:VWA-like domain-containing protein [Clostridium rectalis]|uniref:vWA domain-containing protein n=1 Tax=Clostridium rectalis TaxID=2040295 RepID=UPI000F639631|nr:VWA-like domain-containing protein [Clostridium rectalis]
MGNYRFEKLRGNLLKELYKCDDNLILSEHFVKNFYDLIEICNFSLMKGENNFFGFFIIQMKRNIDVFMPTAIGTIFSVSHFTLNFNPRMFLKYSLEEMQALLKHEIYHIMFSHFIRRKQLAKRYNDYIVDTALDISINQYIEGLPKWLPTIESVKLSFNVDLEYNKTVEYYAHEIYKAMDKLKGQKGLELLNNNYKENSLDKIHETWVKFKEKLHSEQLKELIKKTANNACKGKTPKSVEKALKKLNEKPEVSWSNYLKKIIGTLPVGYKKTITRKNRRQPNRLDLRGKLTNHITKIIVAIDISGSITDMEIEKIMVEIFSILKNHPSTVTIIECDDRIRRVYDVKTLKDLKRKIDTKGGTAFSPVFQYIYDQKLRDYLLIYFTDGEGEKQLSIKPINFKTLWVLTGREQELSLKDYFGEVKKLSNKKIEKNDVRIAIEDMGEITKDWACAANQYI